MSQQSRDEVVAAWAAQITSGVLAPGDRLPSSRALARAHGISQWAAGKVLAKLGEMGLAVNGQQRHEGWYVTRSDPGQPQS